RARWPVEALGRVLEDARQGARGSRVLGGVRRLPGPAPAGAGLGVLPPRGRGPGDGGPPPRPSPQRGQRPRAAAPRPPALARMPGAPLVRRDVEAAGGIAMSPPGGFRWILTLRCEA